MNDAQHIPPSQPTAPAAPNLPCPKCGSPDTAMRYSPRTRGLLGCQSVANRGRARCQSDAADREHFHRSCGRCGYHWRTDDVLPGKTSR